MSQKLVKTHQWAALLTCSFTFQTFHHAAEYPDSVAKSTAPVGAAFLLNLLWAIHHLLYPLNNEPRLFPSPEPQRLDSSHCKKFPSHTEISPAPHSSSPFFCIGLLVLSLLAAIFSSSRLWSHWSLLKAKSLEKQSIALWLLWINFLQPKGDNGFIQGCQH